MTKAELIKKIGDIIHIESITDQHAKGHPVINARMVAEEVVELFLSQLKGSLKEIFSKLPSKADPMSRDEILECIEEVRAELKRLGDDK